MTEQKIPQSFITLAEKAGLNSSVSTEFFQLKNNRKSVDHLKVRLVVNKTCKNEAEASALLTQLWREYRRNFIYGEDNQSNLSNSESVGRSGYHRASNLSFLEQAREGFEKTIGPLKTIRYDSNKRPIADRKVIFSDLHIPFANAETLKQILNDPAEEAWLVGDLLDMFAVSRYRKTADYILVREELSQGRAFLELLAKNFRRVKVLKCSNHPDRAKRVAQELMPQILPLMINPMELLVTGLDNVELVQTQVLNTAPSVKHAQDVELGWIAQEGDVILSHLENFCGQGGVNQVDEWIKKWNHILKLKPYSVVCHAHTHRLGMQRTPSGGALIDTGCACKPMEYMFDGHGKYTPPTCGYVAIYQHNGVTDINRTEIIYAS